jgi:hypothetical protein
VRTGPAKSRRPGSGVALHTHDLDTESTNGLSGEQTRSHRLLEPDRANHESPRIAGATTRDVTATAEDLINQNLACRRALTTSTRARCCMGCRRTDLHDHLVGMHARVTPPRSAGWHRKRPASPVRTASKAKDVPP